MIRGGIIVVDKKRLFKRISSVTSNVISKIELAEDYILKN